MIKPHSRPRVRLNGARFLSALAGSLLLLTLVLAGRATLVEGAGKTDAPPSSKSDARGAKPSRIGSYGQLPLSFEENRGQTDRRVRFVSRGQGYALFLTRDEAVLSLRGGVCEASAAGVDESGAEGDVRCVAKRRAAVLRVGLEGARRGVGVRGAEKLTGESNYFVGAAGSGWRTRVPQFAKVVYESVYPGVDLVYYGNQRQLEYDFRLAPGADAKRIALKFTGAEAARVDERGDLVLSVAGHEVVQRKPFAYQERGGEREEVASRYVVREEAGRFVVGFELGAYDRGRTLVIDPVLVYSTFVGGTDFEQGLGVAVDAQGSAYVTGSTSSLDFPVVGGVQAANANFSDAFVLKLNPAGTSVVYSTYLGSAGDDVANAIAVDAQGNAYVAGFTGSGSFPTTFGAIQTSKSGSADGFLSKLNAAGTTLVYSTFVGGNNTDTISAVAVDAGGNAYFTGRTESNMFPTFPVPPDARQGHPVYRSTDAAANWAASDAGLSSAIANVLGADPTNANVVYAGTVNGLFKSTDGGALWSLTGQVRTGTAPLATLSVAVDPNNPNTVYAGTNGNGGIYKSTDSGNLFDIKNSGLLIPIVNALIAVPSAPGTTTLYAGTSISGVYRSTNGGDTWTLVSGALSTNLTVNELVADPSNPSIIYAGTNVGVIKTVNGGGNWAFVNNGIGIATRITALVIDPANPSTLYAGTTNASSAVFKTTDGGATWSPASTGLSISGQTIAPPVNALSISPVAPQTVYAATTTGGVFKTIDGGATWAAANTGLQNTNATAVLANASDTSKVLAGFNTGGDGFVGKLNASGSQSVYFGLFGGSESENPRGVAVDAAGSAYVTGTTNSANFPTANALQPARAGALSDAFVTKFSADGQSILYSTYLGGTGTDAGLAIAVSPQGHAHVTGQTFSNNFPLAQPIDSTPSLGTSEAFVSKLNTDGASFAFSTYFGGSGSESGNAIAVDARNNVYVVGSTTGDIFNVNPTQMNYGGGISDAFVARFNTNNSTLDFATFLGGVGGDAANAVAVDAQGGIYVVGNTVSANFPLVNPLQPNVRAQDAFVTKFGTNADLSITKRDSRDPVMVNNELAYLLTVVNNGSDPATNVRVSDPLPAGATFVSATPSDGACTGAATVNCDLGDMAAGETAVVVVVVRPTATGTLSNTATVTSDTADLDASDNAATAETQVSSQPSIAGRITTVTTGQFGGQVVPLAGVTVTLSGSQTATATTDADGRYQFSSLNIGGNYTVTPARTGLVFNPDSRAFNNLTADATGDFVAVGCTFTLSPTSQSFPAAGGNGTINVTASDPRCPRTATASVPWISVTSGALASGSGPVTFSVAPTNTSRNGSINIAGRFFNVFQELSPCGTVSFRAATPVSGAPGGFTIVTADFNNDGKPDLAIGTSGGGNLGTITVLLNSGGGQFQSTATFAPSTFTFRALVAGDFNGDGKQDLVSLSTGVTIQGGIAALRLGDGAGHFGAPIEFNFGQGVSSLATGDFNNDGRTDLAVTDFTTGNLAVLLGHATNGLSAPTTVGAPNSIPQANFAAAADFDKDGKTDLAVLAGSRLYFLRGDGAGGFNVPAAFTNHGAGDPTGVSAADANTDGNPDLIITGGAVTVLFGDGAGGFPTQTVLTTRSPRGAVVRDFDGDGRNDLAATFGFGTGFSLFRGLPGNAFAPAESYVAGLSPQSLVAADFDGDGKLDIITVDNGVFNNGGGSTNLVRGDGAGRFNAARTYAATFTPLDTAPADFNGDGRTDLLVTAEFGAVYLPGAATPGEFGAPVTVASGEVKFTRSFSTADFNRDGRPDLGVLYFTQGSPATSGVRVYLNDGAGGFTQSADVTFGNDLPADALFADFNGDGNPDLVYATQPGSTLRLRLGDGAGGFGAQTTISPSLANVSQLAAGDFNGDGRLDIVAGATTGECGVNSPAQVIALYGNGAGGFSAPSVTEFTGRFALKLLAQDVNGDGRADVFTLGCDGRLRILFGRGGAGGFDFGPFFGRAPNVTPLHLELGDLNGDGKPDLIANEGGSATNEANVVTVYTGDGAGSFASPTVFTAGVAPAGIALADFNADGRNDLAFSSITGGLVSVFLNDCPVPAASTVQFSAATLSATEGTNRSVTVTVTRTGDTTGEAFVSYATIDGTASERKDYTAALGRLRFGAGEMTKTFEVVITDDRFAENAETFTVTLSDALGAALGATSSAVVTINSDDAVGAPSPVKDGSFDTEFFVRQHYADFLNRVPDAGGLAFWMDNIDSCGADQSCREVKKVNVSAAFFLSIEFQETGFLAYRAHKAAYGDLAGKPVPVRLRDFLADTRQLGEGVIVGTPGWPEQLEANKQSYFNQFVTRTTFAALYPQTMTAAQYVDALFTRAGIQPTQAERDAAINAFGAGGTTGRAAALRSVAESQTLKAAETNKAFVLMQYFGYLRRNPDDPQDTNFDGFFFWLGKLNQFNGNFVDAEMVRAFISSIEYGDRFGH